MDVAGTGAGDTAECSPGAGEAPDKPVPAPQTNGELAAGREGGENGGEAPEPEPAEQLEMAAALAADNKEAGAGGTEDQGEQEVQEDLGDRGEQEDQGDHGDLGVQGDQRDLGDQRDEVEEETSMDEIKLEVSAESIEDQLEALKVQGAEMNADELRSTNNTIGVLQSSDIEMDLMLNSEDQVPLPESIEQPRSAEDSLDDGETTTNILNQLTKQNIDFARALAAQRISESGDNNNFEKMEEVMNREELLDILEGNIPEKETPRVPSETTEEVIADAETLLALRQLCALPDRRGSGKQKSKQSKTPQKETKGKRGRPRKNAPENPEVVAMPSTIEKEVHKETNDNACPIKVIVEEWADDDMDEADGDVQKQSTVTEEEDRQENQSINEAIDEPTDQQTETNGEDNKSTEDPSEATEKVPQRRISRVIKKKVIFDPDNPDTFTSKKSPNVNKVKTPPQTKDQPPSKKIKNEGSPQRVKEKTSLVKSKSNPTQWKKPQPKNNRQHKRLSEVDKLLMDEGAVNMMYQLNSTEVEAPKGKKNIKSKAAFIKKINENTPESKEIKFRERRKEPIRIEEIPAHSEKKSRSRNSSTNPVQSSLVGDDYETHSAEDSIIFRRHSSSSYSSSCLSPRRLSIDAGTTQNLFTPPKIEVQVSEDVVGECTNGDQFEDVFMSETPGLPKSEILDKKDCLSLKEKLNSKLSRVLNVKRKREGKTDKVTSKQKKLIDKNTNQHQVLPEFKKLAVSFDERVAIVNILREGSSNNVYDVETLKELQSALNHIDKKLNVSVTLLVSDSGNLCGGLDLKSVVQTDKKLKLASELADSVRSLFVCMEQHSKLIAAGVDGHCVGVGLALLALSDVVVASDRATFALLGGDAYGSASIVPGTAVLTSYRKSLGRSLITEMMLFGRQLSAAEALQRGLVSRTLWPDRFNSELRAMVKDIAAQPLSTLQLKKKLLSVRSGSEPKSTFLSCLDAERDLLAAYWSSPEGQNAIRSLELAGTVD